MSGAHSRAVIVVFNDNTGETEAAMLRGGLRMFRGVHKVLPVRSCPSDQQARTILAREEIVTQLREAETQLAELRARLELAQQATTGPMPVPHAIADGVIEWRASS